MTKKSEARLLKDKKENTPPREKSVIEDEYKQFCNMAGDKQYRIKVLEGEMNIINNKLLELNQEAAKLAALPKKETAPEVSTEQGV